MQAFKERAKIIMHTLNISQSNTSKGDSIAFLASRSVKVTISNLAAAFPLVMEGGISQTQTKTGSYGAFPIRAFLFYIKSFSFETHRGETGKAIMDGFSFQFVPRYDFTIFCFICAQSCIVSDSRNQMTSMERRTRPEIDYFILR